MSFAITYCRANVGLNAPLVQVETDLSKGLPKFSIVGLAETAVKESKERVRAAILNSQFEFPAKHITINLAPADLPKRGGRFDLAIAVGILAASQQIPSGDLHHYEFAAELALNGDLRPVPGLLTAAMAAGHATRALIIAEENVDDVCLITELTAYTPPSLLTLCAHLCGKARLSPAAFTTTNNLRQPSVDLSDIRGQQHAKRALEIAAAGQHHLLFIGPPGTGKTMLSQSIAGITTPLNYAEKLEVACLYALHSPHQQPVSHDTGPYRAPHHTASYAAIVGGANPPVPGEISLAHHGVLFLDELPEFRRDVLEALREPLESCHIRIARPGRHETFPAKFQLIAAMNPCPCGYFSTPRCQCTSGQIRRYQQKVSGPLLDRIDLHLQVPPLSESLLYHPAEPAEESKTVQQRVTRARSQQLARQQHSNRFLTGKNLLTQVNANQKAISTLDNSTKQLQLSARATERCLRVARTIADLNGADVLTETHICEALTFRNASDTLQH